MIYFSGKMIDVERNYEIPNAELLAIVKVSVIGVTISRNHITFWKYSLIIAICVRF